MNKKRCPYCGKVITNGIKYCNDTCSNNYSEFEKKANNNIKIFGVSIVILLISIFIGVLITAYNPTIGSFIVCLGGLGVFVTLMIFPFVTPTTIELFGVKKSKIIVRTIILIFGVSIAMSILI